MATRRPCRCRHMSAAARPICACPTSGDLCWAVVCRLLPGAATCRMKHCATTLLATSWLRRTSCCGAALPTGRGVPPTATCLLYQQSQLLTMPAVDLDADAHHSQTDAVAQLLHSIWVRRRASRPACRCSFATHCHLSAHQAKPTALSEPLQGRDHCFQLIHVKGEHIQVARPCRQVRNTDIDGEPVPPSATSPLRPMPSPSCTIERLSGEGLHCIPASSRWQLTPTTCPSSGEP